MDEPISYTWPNIPVVIHPLPSGFNFDINRYNFSDPGLFHIFIFHEIIKGSYINNNNDMKFEHGLSLNDIDRSEFDVILGGDNHVPQMLPLKNTVGGYVGSVMQRTKADADEDRGWLEIEIPNFKYSINKPEIQWNFVPVRGFFSKIEFDVDNTTNFEQLNIPEDKIKDKYLEIKLHGYKPDVDRIADDGRWKNYETLYMARKVEVIRSYVVDRDEVIVDMSEDNSILEDLNSYLDSGFSSIGNIARENIVKVVEDILEERG